MYWDCSGVSSGGVDHPAQGVLDESLEVVRRCAARVLALMSRASSISQRAFIDGLRYGFTVWLVTDQSESRRAANGQGVRDGLSVQALAFDEGIVGYGCAERFCASQLPRESLASCPTVIV